MGKTHNNGIPLPTGIKRDYAGPIDDSEVVDTISDLTTDTTLQPFKGFDILVSSEGTKYRLIDDDASEPSNWRRVDQLDIPSTENSRGELYITEFFDWSADISGYTNTDFIIVKNQDLQNLDISLPDGCILVFKSGDLNNYNSIDFNGCMISAPLEKIMDGSGAMIGSIANNTIYPQWFGAIGDDNNDDTIPLKRCFEIGGAIDLSNLKYRTTEVMLVNKDTYISAKGGSLYTTANAAIGIEPTSSNIVDFHIEGLRFLFPETSGITGKEAFVNYSVGNVVGENTTSFSSTSKVPHFVKNINFTNCNFGSGKVTIQANDYVYINNCLFETTAVQVAPANLQISGDTPDVGLNNESQINITNNNFNVFGVTGLNKDIVKIGSYKTGVIFKNNRLINSNEASAAQIDFFTGGDAVRVVNNRFENVQVHRKQYGNDGETRPIISHDLYQGNHFVITNGSIETAVIYIRGTIFSIANNTFEILKDNVSCVYLDSEEDFIPPTNTKSPSIFLISGNTFNMINSPSSTCILRSGSDSDTASLGNINGNILLGANRFVSGTAVNSSLSNNVWGFSAGANSNGWGSNIVGSGNVSDSTSTGGSGLDTNKFTYNTPIIAMSGNTVIDGSSHKLIRLTGSGNVTDISGGVEGREITLYLSGSMVINHNSNINLYDGVSYDPTGFSTIKLQYISSRWREIARGTHTPQV